MGYFLGLEHLETGNVAVFSEYEGIFRFNETALKRCVQNTKKEKRDASEEVKALKLLGEANKTHRINLKDAFM